MRKPILAVALVAVPAVLLLALSVSRAGTFSGMGRHDLAEYVTATVVNAPVEYQLQAIHARLVVGTPQAEQVLRFAESRAQQDLYQWMIAHGWSGGAPPDFAALLDEEN